ncbi:hypothetical protein H920_12303 [Fukomys damarensis]|uniref:Uncharacterized protein n=1 Tax=Fukomys damarensis TaxID=885580 RepID=A0A091D2H0_FUKDA|nr:hypothetical protein H920_12303 [Fukomys damarensis]
MAGGGVVGGQQKRDGPVPSTSLESVDYPWDTSWLELLGLSQDTVSTSPRAVEKYWSGWRLKPYPIRDRELSNEAHDQSGKGGLSPLGFPHLALLFFSLEFEAAPPLLLHPVTCQVRAKNPSKERWESGSCKWFLVPSLQSSKPDPLASQYRLTGDCSEPQAFDFGLGPLVL